MPKSQPRSALGPAVLDAMLPEEKVAPPRPVAPAAAPRRRATPVRRPTAAEEPAPGAMERPPVLIPAATMERARTATYYTPGMTLARLVREAIDSEVSRMERARGEAFPERTGKLRPGPPLREPGRSR